MWEIIAAILLCAFAIFGFVAFLKVLVFNICKPKSKKARIILDAEELNTETEYTLLSLAQRVKWLGRNTFENIIIIDNGLNDESREICQKFCRENPLFKICTTKELLEIFD